MATKYAVNDQGNDFNLAANYDPSGVPTTGERLVIAKPGLRLINNVQYAQHSIEYIDIDVETEFSGQIGSPTTPLQMGNTGGKTNLNFNGPACQGFHLDAKCELVKILGTLPQVGTVTISGSQTIDEILVAAGIGLVLASGPTYTLVRVDGDNAWVKIESGIAVPTLRAIRGRAIVETQVTNSYIHDADVEYTGTSKTFALVEVLGQAGVAKLNCPKSTISSLKVWNGFADGRESIPGEVAISAGELHRGGKMWFGKHIADGSNVVDWGGDYRGYGTPTQKVPEGVPGGAA